MFDELSKRIAALSPQQRAVFEQRLKQRGLQTPKLQTIPKRPETGPVPLSFGQQRLWFLDQLEPGNPSYNGPSAVELSGPLDIAVLERSLNEVVRRHESLRTTFASIDDQPVQVIASTLWLPLQQIDLRAYPPAEREAEAQRRTHAEFQQPFDLQTGPLLRATLLQLDDTEFLLLFTMHHIITDGWSTELLVEEVATLYDAFVTGQPSPLPELSIQYADFAIWQREQLQGSVVEQQIAYWKQQLEGAPALLSLPTDRPRPPVQSHRGAVEAFELPPTLSVALKTLSQQEDVTLFMLLLAAFNVLMQRYSGQHDIVVGTSVSGRSRSEVARVMGFFANNLALRTDLTGRPSFRELVMRVRATALGAYAHQDLPFELLVEQLNPERSLSHAPIFQVVFTLQNELVPTREVAGVTMRPRLIETATTKLDLILFMWDGREQLTGTLEYSTDLFDAATIARLIEHFGVLLEAIAADPDRSIADLPLLAESESRLLLDEWSATNPVPTIDAPIHQTIAEQARRTPNALAVACGNRSLSYAELERQANQLGHWLQAHGVGPETRVGLCLERSPDLLVGMLGILKSGGAYVPLDPSYPAERLQAMLTDAQASLVVTQERLAGKLRQEPYTYQGQTICLDSDQAVLAAQPETPPLSAVTAQNLAYVIYTSGSTGQPKGVLISHGNLATSTAARRNFYHEPITSFLLLSSFAFDSSVAGIFWTLSQGGTLYLPSEGSHADPMAIAGLLARHQISHMLCLPSLYALVLSSPQTIQLAALRCVIVAGEACSHELIDRHQQTLAHTALFNEYGPTEGTVWCTVYDCADSEIPQPVPIGRPIPGAQIYVLDTQLRPVPIGVSGELYLGGEQAGRGYHERPDLTAERFIPNPFAADGGRLYATGDLARWLSNGDLQTLGRIDQQVKLRGFRIELEEIEAALLEHPGVREAVAIVREERAGAMPKGHPAKRIVAYVVGEEQRTKNKEQNESTENQEPRTGCPPGDQEPRDDNAEWRQHVAEWQQVFDDALAVDGSDLTFQMAGWKSSFTNEPIPAAEMREWVDHTVARVLEHQPRHVLEIGVGTGLLLFRIAPGCERYVGTDIAPLVLDDLRQRLDRSGQDWPQVQLEQRAADDLRGITGPFDTVILNSVVQYFPSIDYLVGVLEQAISLVAPGGRIFIGDVRSLPLLETFHTAVQAHQGSAGLTSAQLRQRVYAQLAREQELVIDPDFFPALREHLPQIGQAVVRLKRGRRDNELARFRYDVVLHIGERPAQPEFDWQDWQEQQLSGAAVRAMLETGPDLLSLRGIPNARVLDDLKLVTLLAQAEDAEPVESLRGALPTSPPTHGVDPEELWALSDTLFYAIDVLPSAASLQTFDVVFRRRGGPWAELATGAIVSPEQRQPWQAYATNPLTGKLQRHLIPALRRRLEQRLPEYMLPSAFVLLPALPKTPNGKLDRKRLPAPDRLRLDQTPAFVAPRTPIERQLATIWAEIVDLERVGVTDNFFALGGHSLLATQVMSRVRDTLQVDLPLRALFEAPTVSGLAALIEAQRQTKPVDEVLPIAPVSRDQPLDLSFAQERLWVLDQLMPGNLFYNMPTAVLLTGPLDNDLLQLSLDKVVHRHESIRTTFKTVAGRPLQIIVPTLDVPIRLVDLQSLLGSERDAEARRLAVEDVRQPFDLTTGPLLRVTLFRLHPEGTRQRHVLFLAMHHIISDGWSLGVLVQEIAALYAAFASGQPSPLPELPIQYADYAIWQRQWLQAGIAEAQLSYWKAQLAEMPQVLELPTDRPRPPVRTANGARRSRALPAELTAGLHRFSQREGVTPFMTLLTAFNVVLHSYTGQDRIVVGSPIANRNRRDIEGLIGFFINALALPTDLTGNPTLRELLARVRETTLGAYANQDLPFERLVAEIQPTRDLSRTPLFQVMFVLQNTPMPALQLPDLTLSLYEIDGGSADYDLKLELVEAEGEMFASLQYNTDLFEAATIDRIHQHFTIALRHLLAEPERRLADLTLLTEAERALLDEWNATTRSYPTSASVHELFEQQAARTPDAIAVVFEARQLSYRELNTRANQLARHLTQHGIQPETHVAICLHRSIEMVVGLLGILKAGAAYLPLDPNYPHARLEWMLADAQPAVVLTQQAIAATLPTSAEIVCLDADWSQIAMLDGDNLASSTHDESAIYAIYTSGSTGQPKGAINTHGGVRNRLLWMQETYGLTADDRVLQKTPFTFDVSVWEFFWPLITGAQLVVARPEGHKDNGYLVDLIEHEGITTLHFVPSMLSLFLAEPGLDRCHSLRRVICSGEALPAQLQTHFFERLNAELHNLYGPTEAAVDVTAWACARDDERRNVPIGRPVANTQIQILDRHLNRLPPGVPGELHIGGVQLARGYLNRPALTAARFIPDPFSQNPGSRLYRTGDLARFLPDGTLEYLGRIDHQVKLRGFRIELEEIEAALRQHEAIREALVLLREDRPGDPRLVAYIVLEQNKAGALWAKEQNEGQAGDSLGSWFSILGSPLREFLAQRLPDYMLPSAFVPLDALPLTPNGKVDRRALPAPDIDRPDHKQGFVAPRTPTEEVIATLWAEVLGLKQVGIFDNFFELGGHSLRAILLLSRVRDVFRVSLPVQSMFEATTVAALAELLINHEEQPGKIDKIARLLQRIAQASPQELAQKLDQRRKDGQRA